MKHLVLSLLAMLMLALPALAQMPQPSDEELEEMGITREQYQQMMQSMQQQQQRPAPIESGPYHHEQHGYTVTVPEGWTGMNNRGNVVMFEGNMQQMSQQPTKIIQVTTVPVGSEEEREFFARAAAGDVNEEQMLQRIMDQPGMEQSVQDYEVLSVDTGTLDGHDAVTVTTKLTQQVGPGGAATVFISRAYSVIAGDKQYNLAYVAQENHWQEMEQFIDGHVSSFEFD